MTEARRRASEKAARRRRPPGRTTSGDNLLSRVRHSTELMAAGAVLLFAACGGQEAAGPSLNPSPAPATRTPADFFPVTVILESDKAWVTVSSLTTAETSSGESGARLDFRGSVKTLSAGTFNYRLSVTDSKGETYQDSGGMLLGEREEGTQVPFQTSIDVPADATLTLVGFWLADTDVLALSYHIDLPVAAIPPRGASGGDKPVPSPTPTATSARGEPEGMRPDYVLQGLPEVLASFGYALALGDINGDGHDDVIAGAPWPDVTPGKVLVFLGYSELGGHPDIVLRAPDGSRTGFGHFLAAGDLTGDSRDEIIIANPFGAGRVYVFSASADPPETPIAVLEGPEQRAGSHLGYPVAVVDVNGDGHDDVIAGAPQLDVDGRNDAGGVLVFLGGNPLDAVCDFVLHAPRPETGTWFGRSVAAGDVNGDGLDDIIVGAYGSSPGGLRSAGQVFVFLSDGDSFEDAKVHVLQDPTPQEEAKLGYAVAAGDIDGDGYDDVIAGAFGSPVNRRSGAGKVLVFRGGAGFDTSADAVLSAPDNEAGAGFGYVLATADVNVDGSDDIIVGSPYSNLGGRESAGEAFLFFGGHDLLIAVAENLIPPAPQEYAYFGVSVAVGDIDGDGAADVIVGGYRASADGQAGSGEVYVFLSPAF